MKRIKDEAQGMLWPMRIQSETARQTYSNSCLLYEHSISSHRSHHPHRCRSPPALPCLEQRLLGLTRLKPHANYALALGRFTTELYAGCSAPCCWYPHLSELLRNDTRPIEVAPSRHVLHKGLPLLRIRRGHNPHRFGELSVWPFYTGAATS